MGSNMYAGNAVVKAPWGISYDANGKGWMYAIAHTTLVLNTPYLIMADEFGNLTAATTANSGGIIGVPDEAGVSGTKVRLQVLGPVAALVTPSISGVVGQAAIISSDIVASSGADYIEAADEFAVFTAAAATSTTQAVMLTANAIIAG